MRPLLWKTTCTLPGGTARTTYAPFASDVAFHESLRPLRKPFTSAPASGLSSSWVIEPVTEPGEFAGSGPAGAFPGSSPARAIPPTASRAAATATHLRTTTIAGLLETFADPTSARHRPVC